MSRGGYMAVELALTRLAKIVGDRQEASRLLSDAMVSGSISARGCPTIEIEEEERSAPMVLRDLGSLPPPALEPAENIPAGFWKAAEFTDRSHQSFETGFAMTQSKKYKNSAYNAITLREKEVNAFISIYRDRRGGSRLGGSTPAARLRGSSWEEWVAALATLAHEHQISGEMKQRELLDLINERLLRWGLSGKDPSTVQPTARKVLERFKTDPPTKPLVVTNPEKP